MPAKTTYDSIKESLLDVLKDISNGKIQLPDFQRGWVWDDEHIKSLLASICLSYPIGAVMILNTGNPDVKFAPRLFEGVDKALACPEPERLVLDGQQRLTSLYQAVFQDNPVLTRDIKKRSIKRWYYIDMPSALNGNGDLEDAIVSLPEDKILRNFRGEVEKDYSTQEKEFEHGLFPLTNIFDCTDWRAAHNAFWNYDAEKIKLFDDFEREVVKRFEQYQIPVILLKKETPKVAVCQVFEKVNTGGVSLSVFELMTATYAADDYKLRDDWAEKKRLLHERPVLKRVDSDDFLQAITLLTTYKKHRETPDKAVTSCKRKDVLNLSLADYQTYSDSIVDAFKKVAKLLYSEKFFTARDLPYRTQLVPLSATLAALGDQADSDTTRTKLFRWFWCGVFGELYGGGIETRFAKDIVGLIDWINGGLEPSTIIDANFAQSRLRNLRTRNSAAYKGLHALLMRDGGFDFRTGEPIDTQVYFDDSVDIHHIFPRGFCQKLGSKGLRLDELALRDNAVDCIVNKTPLTAATNRIIGSNAPSTYLERLQNRYKIPAGRLDEILESHLISPAILRTDDFIAFFEDREHALITRIENAMGKNVNRDVGESFQEEPDEDEADDYDEEAEL